MTQQAVTPWTFYQGWDVYQGHLVKAIEPLTPEQLEHRIAPNLRSIGLLAKHIVRTRASWLALAIGEGGPDADVMAIARWEHDGEVPSTAELVRGLEVTFGAWLECLQRWTPQDMDYIFRGERWGKPYALSRQWVIWHVIERDRTPEANSASRRARSLRGLYTPCWPRVTILARAVFIVEL